VVHACVTGAREGGRPCAEGRCGRRGAGCEARLRAAGGSVGPGGARRASQRAVMSVAARLAAAGTSCRKAGGRAGLRSPRASVSLGREEGEEAAAAEEEQGEGCQIREPDSSPFPGRSLPPPRLVA
jgi:hypothetical protein